MKFQASFITLLTIIIVFVSCEKNIDLSLKSESKNFVVEGTIETGELPYVSLTNSIGFFDKIDLNSVSYVKGGVVKILDITSGKSIQLKQYDIDTTFGSNTFSFTIYGPDITDPNALNFKGEEEHTYYLTVQANGVFADAYTKIPKNIALDSLWFDPVPGKETEYKSLRGLYTDPDTFGNSIRYQTETKRYVKTGEPEIFYDPFSPVYDDQIINGTTFPITFDLGFDRNQQLSGDDFENIGYVRPGDTVTLKWSAIDRKVYKFWETLNFSQNSVGNPFATPLKIQGNVNGALGVWAGYGTAYYTLIDSL